MTDEAVQNALAIRKELAEKIHAAEAKIKEWRARMDRVGQFVKDWEEFSGQSLGAHIKGTLDVKLPPVSVSASGHMTPKNPKKEEVAEAAREILMDRGKPMSRDDLFTALTERGIIIHGKNPPVVLQTMLWRMQNVIVHLKGSGYWTADEAYQAADYVDKSEPEETEEIESLDDKAKTLI